jgi:hypothetical protein
MWPSTALAMESKDSFSIRKQIHQIPVTIKGTACTHSTKERLRHDLVHSRTLFSVRLVSCLRALSLM